MRDVPPLPPLRWRHGNAFRLLVDGTAFYPALLAAIGSARTQVLIEMYLVESGRLMDRFISALTVASQRGVRVCLLLDDFGCLGLNGTDRARLQAQGVELVRHNPLRLGSLRRNLFRDHRKLVIVDGDCAFVGGAGLTDAFDPVSTPERYWHDVMIEIRGPLVSDWQAVFNNNWVRWTTSRPVDPIPGPKIGRQVGRVSLAGHKTQATIKRTLLQRIGRARQRIWLASGYFVPSWKLRRRLARAARRGIDVRVLLPGPYTDHPAVRHAGRRFYRQLLRAGVRIFEYQPRFQHAKVALVDDWVSIGSSNLDRWNLRWNLEANQEIDDGVVATETATLFTTDFAASMEMHHETWDRRAWHARLAERFWGAIDRWVDRRLKR